MSRPAHPAGDRTVVLVNVLTLQGNPYLAMWTDAAEASGARLELLSWQNALGRRGRRPDWVHLQWPERALRSARRRRAALGAARLLAATALARLSGARVLVTAHNTMSHEARHPRLERLLWAGLTPLVTDLHVMTAAGADTFLAEHRGLARHPRHVVPHGDYSPRVAPQDRAGARAATGLPPDGQVLLTFGALRGYKGVDALLDAFGALPPDGPTLVVAGRVLDPGLAERLDRLAAGDARLVVRDGFLPEPDLATLVSAADWVVLPYRTVLNSGSVLLALTLERPVLVPDTPTFREVAGRVGPGWVVCHSGELTPEVLARLPAPPDGRPDLAWCSWEQISGQLRELWSTHQHR